MKRQPGKDIIIFGSGSIVSQLTRHGLIDEYQIVVGPVLLGAGRALFSGARGRGEAGPARGQAVPVGQRDAALRAAEERRELSWAGAISGIVRPWTWTSTSSAASRAAWSWR